MRYLLLIASMGCALLLASCTVHQRMIADSSSRVNFTEKDFSITPVYSGEATVVRVFGIDWGFFIKRGSGYIGNEVSAISVPLAGTVLRPNKADQYALHDLLKRHPEYEVVFYPQFKRKKWSIPGIYSRTHTTVQARLGRLITDALAREEEQED